jgi:hypothetical protein
VLEVVGLEVEPEFAELELAELAEPTLATRKAVDATKTAPVATPAHRTDFDR